MRLGAVQILPRVFRNFLEFILTFLELFLFIRRLNLFLELRTLYFGFIISEKYLEAVIELVLTLSHLSLHVLICEEFRLIILKLHLAFI
jgi:hypothetical protein